jgi:hypothetical protein
VRSLLPIVLAVGIAACAGIACTGADGSVDGDAASLPEGLWCAPVETLVWNNVMPGTRPRCNALLQLRLVNRGGEAIALDTPEAIIAAAEDNQPMRRFTPLMSIDDRRVRDLRLAPGDSIDVIFRAPDFGLEPIDNARHPRARILLRMAASGGTPLRFRGPVTEIFVTQ